jgi:hypothetical protein
MCGIFQCSSLPAVKVFLFNISIYFSVHPNLESLSFGAFLEKTYLTETFSSSLGENILAKYDFAHAPFVMSSV